MSAAAARWAAPGLRAGLSDRLAEFVFHREAGLTKFPEFGQKPADLNGSGGHALAVQITGLVTGGLSDANKG